MKERRRAIDGKLIEKSKSNPGYYKYQFTIKELNGDTNVIPSYGVDMTDALQRILKNEKKEKFNKVYVKKIEPTVMISIFLVWVIMITLSIIMPEYPQYALYGTISLMSIVLFIAAHNFYKNLNK